MIPMPLDRSKSTIITCCSIVICDGCHHANLLREAEVRRGVRRCPFCRETTPSTKEELDKFMMKRIEANDPVALSHKGGEKYNEGNYPSAFEWYTTAAGSGDMEAHCRLALMYHNGHGVEKDRGKRLHYLEEAAIKGHPGARCRLGYHEEENGDTREQRNITSSLQHREMMTQSKR